MSTSQTKNSEAVIDIPQNVNVTLKNSMLKVDGPLGKTHKSFKKIPVNININDKLGGKFKIQLLAKITKCGTITPRFKVKKDEYNNWEQQFLPAYNRGMLLVTTNQGVMSHNEAANKGIGGFLIGYVY